MIRSQVYDIILTIIPHQITDDNDLEKHDNFIKNKIFRGNIVFNLLDTMLRDFSITRIRF